MVLYKCTKCGYVYYAKNGDPITGIKPGVEFDDLPDTWCCPICKADKSFFIKGGE